MTSQQMSKVWTVVSLGLLYYALNSYLVTQGAAPIFSATLIISNRVPAAMLGSPICSILLVLSSLIGIDFARKNGPAWADRIPLVGFEQIDTTAREAKAYQGVMLAVLSFLPAGALIHFWILFSRADLVTTKNPPRLLNNIWDWSELTSLDDPARICNILHRQPELSCEGNITILPGLEPTIFAVVTLVAVVTMFVFWWRVFRSPQSAAEQ
jgi:hypothetical protein